MPGRHVKLSQGGGLRYWWVNQNKTYRHEVPNGYLWSPITSKGGRSNPFYNTMTEVRPGDVIFSFCDTYIKAVGIATSSASPCPKPAEFGAAGDAWDDAGWLVDVAFEELVEPLRPRGFMDLLRPVLPEKYGPLKYDGGGVQAYLTVVTEAMGQLLLDLIGPQFLLPKRVEAQGSVLEAATEAAIRALEQQPEVGDTERAQLVNARRGQGLFRIRVRGVETKCRVTGVTQQHHLVASHIKPWRESSNSERLHGCNGLMLAPHVDHLFNDGFISFEDNGELLVSHGLELSILDAWSIAVPRNVGTFNGDQRHFLEYHRDHVLLQAG